MLDAQSIYQRCFSSPNLPYALYISGFHGSSDEFDMQQAADKYYPLWLEQAEALVRDLDPRIELYVQCAPWLAYAVILAAQNQRRKIHVIAPMEMMHFVKDHDGIRRGHLLSECTCEGEHEQYSHRFPDNNAKTWYQNPGRTANTSFDIFDLSALDRVATWFNDPLIEMIVIEKAYNGMNLFEATIIGAAAKWRRIDVQMGRDDQIALPYDHPWFKRLSW